MTRDDLLARVQVVTPCQQRWESMPGTRERRHCAECRREVVDLSSMHRSEANRFLATEEGQRACVTFLPARDGSPRSLDDGLTAPARGKSLAAAVMLSLAACGKGPPDAADPQGVSPVTKLDPSLAELEVPPCDTPEQLKAQARQSLVQHAQVLAQGGPGRRSMGMHRITTITIVRGASPEADK